MSHSRFPGAVYDVDEQHEQTTSKLLAGPIFPSSRPVEEVAKNVILLNKNNKAFVKFMHAAPPYVVIVSFIWCCLDVCVCVCIVFVHLCLFW